MDWSPSYSVASGSTDNPVVADSSVFADIPSIIELSDSPIAAEISNRYVMAAYVSFVLCFFSCEIKYYSEIDASLLFC